MVKTPFNWLGTKYKYVNYINSIIHRYKYEKIIDMFMGSGSVLLNIGKGKAEEFVGNDILDFVVKIYSFMRENDLYFKEEELRDIASRWENFKGNRYYDFRDEWNRLNKGKEISKDFIYYTVILLKTCLNSRIRFNSKGEFNQGFRGISKVKMRRGQGFFSSGTIKEIAKNLNNTQGALKSRNIRFMSKDFRDIELPDRGSLLIIDPPYILGEGIYGGEFTNDMAESLLDIVENTENHFIYFNYLKLEGCKGVVGDMINKDEFTVVKLEKPFKVRGKGLYQEVMVRNF